MQLPIQAIAQQQAVDFPADSAEISIRTIDAETFQSLTSDREFEYNEVPEDPDSLWSRIRAWVFDLLQKLFENQWASIFIRIAFIAIFAVVLISVINQFLGGNLTSSFSGKNPERQFSLNVTEHDLAQKDYDTWLQSALSENNYKDAVRILYLKTLQELNKLELISWKADKTNSDYMQELTGHPAKSTFGRLTYMYEYVEYGDFEIGEHGFLKFQEIYQNLELSHTS